MSNFNSKMTGYEILERKVLDSEKTLKEGNSIIDVETLPISNISRKTFYKTSEGIFYYDGEWHNVSEGGSDLSKIDALDTSYSQKVADLDIYDDGIRFEDKFSLMDEDQNDIVMGEYMGRIPILPGKNITFEKDNTNKVIKINATGGSGGSGGVSSWNDLEDKPFYDASVKETISRNNGSIGSSISYTTNSGEEYMATRYSEKTYTKDQLIGSVVNTTNGQYTINSSHIVEESSNGLWIKLTDLEHIWVAYTPNYQPDKFSSTFPVGTYLSSYISPGGMEVICVNSLDINYTDVKCIDEKYIPDTIARKGEGGSTAIIDVDTLPTENINANAFYRVKGEYYSLYNGEKNTYTEEGISIPINVYTVDILHESGIDIIDAMPPTVINLYVQTSDNKAYGYSSYSGYAEGSNFTELGLPNTIVVTSPNEATETGIIYLVQGTPKLFSYNGTEWTEYAPKGEGSGGGKLYLHDVTIQKETFTETVAEFYAVNLRILSRQSTELSVNDVITAIADGKYTVLGSAIEVDLNTEDILIYPILVLGTLNREVISGVVTNPGDLYFEFGVYNIAKSVEIQNADIQAVLQHNGITEV